MDRTEHIFKIYADFLKSMGIVQKTAKAIITGNTNIRQVIHFGLPIYKILNTNLKLEYMIFIGSTMVN